MRESAVLCFHCWPERSTFVPLIETQHKASAAGLVDRATQGRLEFVERFVLGRLVKAVQNNRRQRDTGGLGVHRG